VANNPENWTGIAFEPTFALPSASAATATASAPSAPLTLVGVGVRCVKGLCVLPQARAYAAGLYVDPQQIAVALEPQNLRLFKPVASNGAAADAAATKERERDRAFESLFLSDPLDASAPRVARAVVMRFANDVPAAHVTGGFRTSLPAFSAVFSATPQIRRGAQLVVSFGDGDGGGSGSNSRVHVWWDGKLALSGATLPDGGRALA
jgi:hypothetical protein